jgi:hypothetical protein
VPAAGSSSAITNGRSIRMSPTGTRPKGYGVVAPDERSPHAVIVSGSSGHAAAHATRHDRSIPKTVSWICLGR